MLKRAAAAGAATTVPGHTLAQAVAEGREYRNLTPREAETLEAVAARLIPNDENGPGALEAGATEYIDRALGGALSAFRGAYTRGLAAMDAHALAAFGQRFHALSTARQDEALRDLERNAAEGFVPDAAGFFNLVLGHTLEGTFSDPYYGGNRDFIGWELIGYPGIRLVVTAEEQRLTAPATTRVSAYDLPMFEADLPGGDLEDDG